MPLPTHPPFFPFSCLPSFPVAPVCVPFVRSRAIVLSISCSSRGFFPASVYATRSKPEDGHAEVRWLFANCDVTSPGFYRSFFLLSGSKDKCVQSQLVNACKQRRDRKKKESGCEKLGIVYYYQGNSVAGQRATGRMECRGDGSIPSHDSQVVGQYSASTTLALALSPSLSGITSGLVSHNTEPMEGEAFRDERIERDR